MSGFTKGPWVVVRRRVTVSVQDLEGVYITENVRRLPQQDANASLIASAPELYEFVKRVADQKMCDEERDRCESQSGPYCGAHDWFFFDDDIRKARVLIAKASGVSK